MTGLKVDLHGTNQRKLRVVHVATQAIPFVKEDMKKGLSEVAGKVPAALTSLGVETSLVLPLFKTTEETIREQGHQLEDLDATLRVQLGAHSTKANVKTLLSPLEPGYPVYFIENADLFGQDEMYGLPNDLERFAFFCQAAMRLQNHLGTAPDVFNLHDWHTALIPLYLNRIISSERTPQPGSDLFFENTKSVFTIHEFLYTGGFIPISFYEAGLGLESHLPGYAEFHGRLNLLKAGLHQADRSCARSQSYIEAVVEGSAGHAGFSKIAKERLEAERLVGLCMNDRLWGPDQELTDKLALKGAKHLLGIYRSVVNRPFPGMELAEQTSPPLTYLKLTPQEKLESISKTVKDLYEKLGEKDKSLIDQALEAGEKERFDHVKNQEDLDNILSLLRIKPSCDFEGEMRGEGLGEFLSLFHPGDLNRILSVKIGLKKLKELVDSADDLKPTGKISLYNAMKKYKKSETRTLFDHMFELFRTLRLISSVPKKSETELAQELEKRGDLSGEESLAHATAEFRQFYEVYSFISQPENRSFYRAFLIGILLHDLGTPIKHDLHASEGVKLFEKIKELKGLLNKEELEFTANLIRYHSLLGDTLEWEQNPDDIKKIYNTYKDKKLRDLLAKCLYLLGISDINASGEKGNLSPLEIRRVRRAYNAVYYASSQKRLEINLERIGFGQESKGESRWRGLTIRKKDSEPQRLKDAEIVAQELRNYCRKKLEKEKPGLFSQIKKARSGRKKKAAPKGKRRRTPKEIKKRVEIKIREYYKRLGALGVTRKLKPLAHSIEEAQLRARLLIWLIEYSQTIRHNDFSFEFSPKFRNQKKFNTEMAKLIPLLKEFDLGKITEGFRFGSTVDPESKKILVEISIAV